MKKYILFLILTIWCSTLYSQTFHLNLGTSLSKLDWKYIYQEGYEQQYDDPLLSYAFSTGVEYLEQKYYSISSDLLFYRSGGNYSEEELNTNFVFNSPEMISVSYLSLGSSFNYNPLNNNFKLQLSLGPRIDYIISGTKNEPYNWIDEGNGLNKFNFGFTAGVGLYYNIDDYVFGLNAQYLYRFKKLADLEPSDAPQYTYGGAVATEEVILFGVSLGYLLK
jgi:hypothetical protein